MSKRQEFSRLTKQLVMGRSKGICECHLIPHVFPNPCGQKLIAGRIRFEHIIPDEILHDNSIDNAAVLTTDCWRFKTDHYDKPTIAKSNRIRNKHLGMQTTSSRPMPCGKKSRFKKTFRYGVVLRDTNERVH